MKKMYLLFFSIMFCSHLFAQNFELSGKVTDGSGNDLQGAELKLSGEISSVKTDRNGRFVFSVASGTYQLKISFQGYMSKEQTLFVQQNKVDLNIVLHRKALQLDEVFINDNGAENRRKTEALNVEAVKRDFILTNLGGSLMKSLERLPGVKTIGIGSGQSKPLIRGMGFNRVVVADKGMKHEGQQWGADHGLELDQYATGDVEIVKGAASFVYGSDAIAGVIDIKPPLVPTANTIGANIDLTGKSNNAAYGTSVNVFGRSDHWFFDSRVTYQNYGDYRVPTDTIYVYDYAVALKDGYLRNTAGRETDLHLTTGYIGNNFRSVLYVSNVASKGGFFANAHGLEPRRVNEFLHDASSRDIQMPSQQVDHFKLISKNEIRFAEHRLKVDLGFQHNFREEFSAYVNHGYMPPIYPASQTTPSNLERQFDKYVYSANVKDELRWNGHQLNVGLNAEYQKNSVDGWSFLVPAFRQAATGLFIYDKYTVTEKILFHAAVRYDYGQVDIDQYRDWFATPIGSVGNQSNQNLIRAEALTRNFNSFVYALGMNFNDEQFSLKCNIGKSFRMPIAKELGANGVNYHYFSYEKGNPNLAPEVSYQVDFGLGWKAEKWSVNFTPFYNYFPNYIYLNPTAYHDYDYGAGNQVFEYAQSKVMRYGAELDLKWNFAKHLSTEMLAEYLYARQLSGEKKGYVLPFSPPPSVLFNLSYHKDLGKTIRNTFLSVDYRLTASQNNIVPPEQKTSGYSVINLQSGTTLNLGEQVLNFRLQVQNLFDTRYLNHTSFYRLIQLPEAGRNFVLTLSIPLMLKKSK
ncbi:TonB-dependent receptor [Pedobacter sp. AW1-32]|uniref:TonB-dependent receptor n=1 Tax=Pedobacter sp. AW1-32 TaxID=3383026 RepID=UPI003FF0A42B